MTRCGRSARTGVCVFFAISFLVVAGWSVADESAKRKGYGRGMREDNAPKVGDVAPTFKLSTLDGDDETDLESFRGEKPVVLFFGSYT
ncbi:MAG: hypothetical protein O7D32_10400 [bacterium]|nr:hypothetical protein [bacterium]